MSIKTKILPIILSGGFGTRLWPISRQMMPKQFIEGVFDETLFNGALKSVSSLSNKGYEILPTVAVSNINHKFFILEEFAKAGISNGTLLLEPCARNTAAAILMACSYAKDLYHEDKVMMVVIPSDHVMEAEKFAEAVIKAVEASNQNIVIFGISPDYPATGYGYIKKGVKEGEVYAVEKFCEKPNQNLANEFIASKAYFWNLGIFCAQTEVMLEAYKKNMPESIKIIHQCLAESTQDANCITIKQNLYEKLKDISIDYAIIEKSNNIRVVEFKGKWSDVGDFKGLYDNLPKDENGCVNIGETVNLDSKNCLIISDSSKPVYTLGMKNTAIIKTEDAILVCDMSQTQRVKEIVALATQKHPNTVKYHKKVMRPWGYYEDITNENNYRVKKLWVRPHGSLSLQLHKYRSEHWVVISGIATVYNDGVISDLKAGESTFIAQEKKHRLQNNTDTPVEIIEVQMGSYLGEDDIIRFEDIYGRAIS